jgi:CRP/FNR family cyclic AMP-dependent transcriptional regulator
VLLTAALAIPSYPAHSEDGLRPGEASYENFRTAFQIISNLAISSADKRVADRLLLEVETRGDDEGWIEVSQSELASLTAISLPTLKRVMRRFADAGSINLGYAKLQIVDRAALARLRRRAD